MFNLWLKKAMKIENLTKNKVFIEINHFKTFCIFSHSCCSLVKQRTMPTTLPRMELYKQVIVRLTGS